MDDEPPKTGRRTFLALGVSAVLAGCVQGGGGGNSSNSTTMRDQSSTPSSSVSTTTPRQSSKATTPSTTTPGAPTGTTERRETVSKFVKIRSNESQPQTTASITDTNPSTNGSARIRVWNDAETARKIRVTLTKRNSETSVLHETYRLEADAYVEIDITKPGKYTLGVGVDGDDPTTIDFEVDTCNSLGVNVAVRGDGTVNSTQVSTAVGCRPVTTTE